MKRVFLTLYSVICVLGLIPFFCVVKVRAADPRLYLYPDTGYAVLNKDFAVDIMLDTGGQDVVMTRAAFRFDPDKIHVTKAQHGDLFCQYPEEEYTVDNASGWVVLMGVCTDPAYNSGSEPGLFGRITFTPLVEGEVEMTFEYSGVDETGKSVIMDSGSPPQNVMSVDPRGGTYKVVSSIPSGTKGDTTDTGDDLPGVGLFDNRWFIIGCALICGSGVVLLGDRAAKYFRKKLIGNDDSTVIL